MDFSKNISKYHTKTQALEGPRKPENQKSGTDRSKAELLTYPKRTQDKTPRRLSLDNLWFQRPPVNPKKVIPRIELGQASLSMTRPITIQNATWPTHSKHGHLDPKHPKNSPPENRPAKFWIPHNHETIPERQAKVSEMKYGLIMRIYPVI